MLSEGRSAVPLSEKVDGAEKETEGSCWTRAVGGQTNHLFCRIRASSGAVFTGLRPIPLVRPREWLYLAIQ